MLAWSLGLDTIGCCAAFLGVTVAVIRPLTRSRWSPMPPSHWSSCSATPPSGWW
jgi:hypothetical protein